jgi:hypothetical protein
MSKRFDKRKMADAATDLRPLQLLDHPGRYAGDDAVGGHVLGDHGPGRYHCVFADSDARHHRGVGPEAGVVPDDDGPGIGAAPLGRVERVVGGDEVDFRANR